MQNVFNINDVNTIIERISKLNTSSTPLWGKMNVAQMLAHCNVTYEMVYENKHTKPTGLKKMLLKLFVKKYVVNEKPYAQNGRTAPEFIIANERDFEVEKKRLIDYIKLTLQHGEAYFEGKESHSFGVLTAKEWNNMFAKHLHHHLSQFGV